MSQILQGIINVYTAGALITGKPSPVLQIVAAKSTGTFPNIIFLLILVTAVVMVLLYRTKWGATLFGVGENETAAYLSGVNTRRVRTIAFIMSGTLASLIGLLLLGNMGVAFKDMGSDYVLPSIAAAVVGGVSLSGGDGNYIGVILGPSFSRRFSTFWLPSGGAMPGNGWVSGSSCMRFSPHTSEPAREIEGDSDRSLSWIARQALSGVNGRSRMGAPIASRTADPTAAAVASSPPSPVPLAP